MKKLCLLLLALLLAVAAFAACDTETIPALIPSEGLEFTSNGDKTCYVSGIGTCTDTDIVIPLISPAGDSVTSIGDCAFYNCTGLTSIVIPDSVTSIGDRAFYGCSSLTSVAIPDSVTSIGSYAFSDCSGLTSITVAANNTVYHGAGNCIIETASKTLIAGCQSSIIPTDGSVTSIGDGAFYNCKSLTSVTIPDSVTSIGGSAFSYCSSLTSITVAANNTVYHGAGNCIIETASKTLIAGCQSSIIPTDGSVTSIGEYAFSYCSSLTSVVIPDSVMSIGEGAFWGCSGLTSVVIPDSVTSIGSSAFQRCTSLTDVYYTGTAAEWQAISIGSSNSYLTSATVHYNYVPEA